MTRATTARSLASAFLVVASATHAQSPLPASKVDGWIIGTRVTLDSGAGRSRTVLFARMAGSGSRLRLESSSLGGSKPPVVQIVDTTTRTSMVIDASRSTVFVQPRLEQHARVLVEPMMVAPWKDLGRSDSIAGFATRHYTVEGVTESRITFDKRSCIMRHLQSAEFWMTTDVGYSAAMKSELALSRAAVGVSPALANSISGESHGVAVRAKSTRRETGADGKPRAIVVSTEVVEFNPGPIDATLFDAPAGYKLLSPPSPLLGPKIDSLMHAAEAKRFAQMVDSTRLAPGDTRRCTNLK